VKNALAINKFAIICTIYFEDLSLFVSTEFRNSLSRISRKVNIISGLRKNPLLSRLSRVLMLNLIVLNSFEARTKYIDSYIRSVDEIELVIKDEILILDKFKSTKPDKTWKLPKGCDWK
jgi:hypothetical protein